MILVHLIRTILRTKPSILWQLLFIKDGLLAFFGQTANMHQPMRALVKFLVEQHNFYLAGLEKSGAFVEHADEIANLLAAGSVLILDDKYIYRYILPGGAPANPYGSSTYYSNKLIFKTSNGAMHVVTVPTTESKPHPTEEDLRNLQVILTNIEKLRCDMYDNSLIPVALVNKLVSLANHPSTRILRKFAVDTMGHQAERVGNRTLLLAFHVSIAAHQVTPRTRVHSARSSARGRRTTVSFVNFTRKHGPLQTPSAS
jgi:hypothetical protein